MENLFEQVGGETSVNFTVDIFYDRVLNDSYIKHFFERIDISTHIPRQKSFLTKILGGPHDYTGLDMREAHKHLVRIFGLNDSHFDHILCHLRATLAQVGIEHHLIDKIIIIAESHRNDVLNR